MCTFQRCLSSLSSIHSLHSSTAVRSTLKSNLCGAGLSSPIDYIIASQLVLLGGSPSFTRVWQRPTERDSKTHFCVPVVANFILLGDPLSTPQMNSKYPCITVRRRRRIWKQYCVLKKDK